MLINKSNVINSLLQDYYIHDKIKPIKKVYIFLNKLSVK